MDAEDAEALGVFAGRVLGAFLTLVVLAGLVLACVVVAYFAAPSEKRHMPQGAAAAPAARTAWDIPHP